jgi:2-hydroxy-4-carboxymuconate semialdehyde hemiacetal dehydrogenase
VIDVENSGEEGDMKIGVAGQGAFGVKHLEAIAKIPGIEVITLTGGNQVTTAEVAKKFNIPHFTGDLAESLKQPGLEAMILATPTGLHAKQGELCMRAGKHVQIEIPIADNLADSKRLVEVRKATGVVCMGGHTRRFNPSHQYVHKKIKAGELTIQQMNVQTFFFRRTNMNAAGNPRSWTDHLLWHHACHTVDLFQYQTGELVSDCYAVQGPFHPKLGIAMDIGIVMKVPSGAICTLSLSFNNKGPQGTFFRYICDNGTFVAYYDDLFDGDQNKIDLSKVDVSMNGIELQDREFFAAIKEKRTPNADLAQCYTAMETLDKLDHILSKSLQSAAR